MKVTNGFFFVSLGIASTLAGCGSSSAEPAEPAAGPTKMEARASTAEATPKIAAAECEREMKCKMVGESLKFSSMEHCQKVKSEALTKDFNEDADCKNGISATDLDECVTKTTAQTCDGLSSVIGNAERSAECGSRDLCMD